MPQWPLYRENRVPYYQRLYQQQNAHKRLWHRSPRSKFLLYPFHVIMWGTFGATMYAMVRLMLGHKTWYGKG